jgi:SAM-dependent methyltransferase
MASDADLVTQGLLMFELDMERTDLRATTPLPLMQRVERAYIEKYGENPSGGGWYKSDTWLRISRVFERLDKGGDVLDVGTGAGQFVNCLALSDEFRSVTTIDPTRFAKYIELSDKISRHDISIADMKFDDDAFDVVVCMEVLEHLPEEIFRTAIAELRRVCRGQLLITVPYREPLPLSKTHVRRFEDADFARLFPHASFNVLMRPRMPWMVIEERPQSWVDCAAAALADDVTGTFTEERAVLQQRVSALESQLATLGNRKSLRAANWMGKACRRTVTQARSALGL